MLISRETFFLQQCTIYEIYADLSTYLFAGYESNKIVILQSVIMMSFWGGYVSRMALIRVTCRGRDPILMTFDLHADIQIAAQTVSGTSHPGYLLVSP